MSRQTERLGLEKPTVQEYYDVELENRNTQKLDDFAKEVDIRLAEHSHDNRYYTKTEIGDLYGMLDAIAPAEMHRTVFRGKNLGSSLTSVQKANIQNGTFKGLWLGDYWEIEGRIWRIVDMDYWYNCGDSPFTKHHLVIMPDKTLYDAQMNETKFTTGGYVGSKMYTTNLSDAKTLGNSAFGNAVLTHRELLVNAVKNGYPSDGSWYDSTVELPSEIMIYGGYIHTPAGNGTIVPHRYTISNSQLALMAACPRFIKTRQTYWLRNVVTSVIFSAVGYGGHASYYDPTTHIGVRPVFPIG